MYPVPAIRQAPGEIISGGFLISEILQRIAPSMLRIFFASVALVAITIVLLLNATHHSAHAKSPAHCGFWTEIEAGLSCC